MPSKKKPGKKIRQYEHTDKERLNNPPVGLVTPKTDKDGSKKKYQYDPHLDPQLQWAGKAEHTSFEVDTVSLHVHERIDPKTIIEAVKKDKEPESQMSLFASEEKPLREAIEFYKHKEGWTNRLVAGDSLLVMNSLLEKEGMGGKVQMVYFDPPYGIKYGSNFQPFVNKRDVKDGKDEDLTSEPEMIKAFRDTWELGIHSYLTYLRDRLLLARELLHESGSVFVQISDENVHHVREIMDEVFGVKNFVNNICFQTSPYATSNTLPVVNDYLIWYAKDKNKLKYRQLFKNKEEISSIDLYRLALSPDGKSHRPMTKEELKTNKLPKGWKRYQLVSLVSQGASSHPEPFVFEGKNYFPPPNSHWKIKSERLDNVAEKHRIQSTANSVRFRSFIDDFPVSMIHNLWTDTITGSFTDPKKYVVQTNSKVIERCLLMTTDPGDLVLDITCGSGTTAAVAEQWGRRWITCDTSRVAITLAKQRLMTANFDYYQLAHPDEGIGSGLKYKTVPHITLKSIANNEPPAEETLYDQPLMDKKKTRITGPFTVEAVPSPVAKSLEETGKEQGVSDKNVTRSGETLRQNEWREELLRAGVRAKGGKIIHFTRVELMAGTRYLHAEGETKENKPKKVMVSFGPEHAPLEQRQVEEAWHEARPFAPDILLFCAFQFDEEAAKDIDEMNPDVTGMQFLKAQMNADMLTHDLKKKRSSNESFWLVGQPDVRVSEIKKGEHKGKIEVEVLGFDYYNPKTGDVESGGQKNIAMWMLDTDYDERSLFPSQVFFPMAGAKEGWSKLAKNLKADIDEEKIEAFRGTKSLPFEKPKSKRIAVKIIDDRGIESLKIIRL